MSDKVSFQQAPFNRDVCKIKKQALEVPIFGIAFNNKSIKIQKKAHLDQEIWYNSSVFRKKWSIKMSIFRKKDVGLAQTEMKRHLTLRDVVLLGIGAMVGTGIFTITGTAAPPFTVRCGSCSSFLSS